MRKWNVFSLRSFGYRMKTEREMSVAALSLFRPSGESSKSEAAHVAGAHESDDKINAGLISRGLPLQSTIRKCRPARVPELGCELRPHDGPPACCCRIRRFEVCWRRNSFRCSGAPVVTAVLTPVTPNHMSILSFVAPKPVIVSYLGARRVRHRLIGLNTRPHPRRRFSLSAPPPPVIVSAPAPPVSVSLPAPPMMTKLAVRFPPIH